jgi:hypothetical protein
VLARIAACWQLPENWDGEDAFPVPEEVASRARDLVAQVAEEANVLGLHWQDPAVAPSPDGAIELSWEAGERWSLLVILPGQAILECVLQDSGSSPRHGKVSVEEGVQLALWALGRAPHDAALAP